VVAPTLNKPLAAAGLRLCPEAHDAGVGKLCTLNGEKASAEWRRDALTHANPLRDRIERIS
jgi:hypothetical protein